MEKYHGYCKGPSLLGESERTRIEREKEIRKQRLLQVREQSKEFARKMRDRVAQEQKRQKGEIERTQAREMQEWRKQIFAKAKGQDNPEAIFQKGYAQKAAKEENERQREAANARSQKYQEFRKQLVARRVKQQQLQQRVQVPKPTKTINKPKTTATTTKTKCTQTLGTSQQKCNECGGATKRKRKISFKPNRRSCGCPNTSTNTSVDSDATSCEDTSFDSSSTLSTELPTPKKSQLVNTQRIDLDIEVGSQDSIVIETGRRETTDKHLRVQTSSQAPINNKVKMAPGKVAKVTASDRLSLSQTKIKEKSSEKSPTRSPAKELPQQSEQIISVTISPSKTKRFTQITDFLEQKQNKNKDDVEKSPRKSSSSLLQKASGPESPSKTLPKSVSLGNSPRSSPKKPASIPPLSPPRGPSKKTSSTNKTVGGQPASTTSSAGTRVQFYDYNNKFEKEYDAASTTGKTVIHIRSSRGEGTAMEAASKDKIVQKVREQELDKLRKNCEERCQKALDREKIRREYIDLTEKLEALSSQNNSLLPNESNLKSSNVLASELAIRERKLNNALEEMLSRPAIITCPEVDSFECSREAKKERVSTAANRAVVNLADVDEELGSGGSSASILLGYVNEETEQLRDDLMKCNQRDSGSNKEAKLRDLLARIEKIRACLLQELNKTPNAEKVQEVLDSIGDLRKERDTIVDNRKDTMAPIRSKVHKEAPEDGPKDQVVPLKTRAKGKENKLRAYSSSKPIEIVIKVKDNGAIEAVTSKQQLSRRSSSSSKSQEPSRDSAPSQPQTIRTAGVNQPLQQRTENENMNRQDSYNTSNSTSYRSLPSVIYPPSTNLTHEVLQTIQNALSEDDGKRGRSKRQLNPLIAQYIQRLLCMSPSSIRDLPVSSPEVTTPSSSVINISTNQWSDETTSASSQECLQRVEKFIAENRSFIGELEETLQRHTNATADSSMRLFDEVWKKRLQAKKEPKADKESKAVFKKPIGQAPKAKQKHQAQQKPAADVGKAKSSTQSLAISHNRKEAERDGAVQAVSTQATKVASKEAAKGRHERDKKATPSVASIEQTIEKILSTHSRESGHRRSNQAIRLDSSPQQVDRRKSVGQGGTGVDPSKSQSLKSSSNEKQATRSKETIAKDRKLKSGPPESKQHSSQTQSKDKLPVKSTDARSDDVRKPANDQSKSKMDTASQTVQGGEASVGAEEMLHKCEDRFRRFIEETSMIRRSNIAKLDESLKRVRETKQLLLENTLTTISDSGPEDRSRSRSTGDYNNSEGTESKLLDSNLLPMSSPEEVPVGEERGTLEKHKPVGGSRDSGINLSRPVTSQGQHQEGGEPLSLPSTSMHNSAVEALFLQQQQRKAKPPATLKRFSPQLMDEDMAHELSTIAEVDTPNSRLNTSMARSFCNASVGKGSAFSFTHTAVPQYFPTFEQYARRFDLDVTQMGGDESAQYRDEYMKFLQLLKEARETVDLRYQEFPSMSTYLRAEGNAAPAQNLSMTEDQVTTTVEGLISPLRIRNAQYMQFPSRREFLQEIRRPNSPEYCTINSASLENITDVAIDNLSEESATMNIGEELRRRNIVSPTCCTERARQEQIFSSTAMRNETGACGGGFLRNMIDNESGIEPFRPVCGTALESLEEDLKDMGIKWPAAMRTYERRRAEVLSESSTSSSSRARNVQPCGRKPPSMSFADFFDKEIQVEPSNSSSLCNDLASNSMINAVLDSMKSTSTTPQTGNTNSILESAQGTRERQKTSTPVRSQTQSPTHRYGPSTSNNLFSGDSHLSSVDGPGRTPSNRKRPSSGGDQEPKR